MNIGIDASRADRPERTGVENYAHEVIERMARDVAAAPANGTQLTLYCQEEPSRWLSSLQTPGRVTVRKLAWPLPYLWTQGRLAGEMATAAPDLLFVPASAMPFIHGGRTVTTIHDVGFLAYPQHYTAWQRQYLTWSTGLAVKRARALITVSEFSRQELIRYFSDERGLAAKLKVIPLGVSSERFSRPAGSDRRLQPYGIRTPYILFVGRLEQKKNIEGVIRAFALFKRQYPDSLHQLVLAGKPGYGWETARRLIVSEGVAADVCLPGYVADNDMPLLYANADIFFFPSLYEGFGLPVLEAMAASVPVVASTAGSLPEICGTAALLAEPDDYLGLAKHLYTASTNQTLRAALIAAGIRQTEAFNWKKTAQATLRFLTDRAAREK